MVLDGFFSPHLPLSLKHLGSISPHPAPPISMTPSRSPASLQDLAERSVSSRPRSGGSHGRAAPCGADSPWSLQRSKWQAGRVGRRRGGDRRWRSEDNRYGHAEGRPGLAEMNFWTAHRVGKKGEISSDRSDSCCQVFQREPWFSGLLSALKLLYKL